MYIVIKLGTKKQPCNQYINISINYYHHTVNMYIYTNNCYIAMQTHMIYKSDYILTTIYTIHVL